MSQLPTKVSESTRKRNPHIYGQQPEVGEIGILPPRKERVRQSKAKLNQLEQEFYQHLLGKLNGNPRAQDVTFKLANGVRYTPDFTVSYKSGLFDAYEVKGPRAWDDALVKIKVAANEWPEISWHLVWKDKDGNWCDQTILPK